jgi:glucose/mannose-6-phosphate isomerase
MFYESLKNFNKQFEYEPKIENSGEWNPPHKFLIVGMGGSGLNVGVLKILRPDLDVIGHSDYGLPKPEENLKERLIILNSYSGNTEEVISAFREALTNGLKMIVISTGGELIKLAQTENVPYIQMPDMKMQPRLALGLNMLAILKAIKDENFQEELKRMQNNLESERLENIGKELAIKIKGKIPIIYSSLKNLPISHVWKVNFNETAKVPAFSNFFPELNHNEMASFDYNPAAEDPTSNLVFIFLRDEDDEPRIQKRMDITQKILEEKGYKIEIYNMTGDTVVSKTFSSLIAGFWTGYCLAQARDIEPDEVKIIDEFKQNLSAQGGFATGEK